MTIPPASEILANAPGPAKSAERFEVLLIKQLQLEWYQFQLAHGDGIIFMPDAPLAPGELLLWRIAAPDLKDKLVALGYAVRIGTVGERPEEITPYLAIRIDK